MEPTLPPQKPVAPVVSAPPLQPPSPAPLPPTTPVGHKTGRKKVLLLLAVLLFIGVAGALGYYAYKMIRMPTHHTETPAVATVTVPKDAIVTAECVAGRGKQYILTKDIPDGPIYDVVNGKVVAIEYLIGLADLLAKPEDFKNLILEEGQYDHLALVPTNPHAGMSEQHFHAIAYLVSVEEAKSITCNGSAASSTMDMTTHH